MLKQDNNQIDKLENKISILEKKIIKLEKIVLTNNLNKNDYIENSNIENSNINNDFIDSYNIDDEVNLDNIPINRCINTLFIEPKLVRQYAFDNRLV